MSEQNQTTLETSKENDILNGMDRFLRHSFTQWIYGDNMEGCVKLDKQFNEVIDRTLYKYLSKEVAQEISEEIGKVYVDLRIEFGVEGMKLAIGTMNGTIEPTLYI